MRTFLVISLIITLVELSNGFACTKDYCQLVRCAAVECDEKTEIFVEKGGTCHCCDACYKKLYEGERCTPSTQGGGAFLAKCVDGLVCGKKGICVREKNCH